jgi:hypothetical protein
MYVESDMNLSYQEKSIWGSLIATLIVCGRYFATGYRAGPIGTVTLLVVIQVVAQIAIALAAKPEPKDERDRLIETRGYRNGYLFLVLGTIVCMNIGVRLTVGALLTALMSAEIGKSITQLFYYRRGV